MYEFGNPLPQRGTCGDIGTSTNPVAAARAQVLAQQLSATKTSQINTAPQGCRLYSNQAPVVSSRGALVGSSAPSSAVSSTGRATPSPCGGLFTGNATCSGGSGIFIPLAAGIRGATSWGRHPATSYTQPTSQQNYTGTNPQCVNNSPCQPFIPLMAAVASPYTNRGGLAPLFGQGGFRI
jgi:hypothetical protein